MAKKESHIKSIDIKSYLNTDRVEVSNIAGLCTDIMKIYGANINLARVFPEVHDGLKLVERRILFAMYTISKAYKKMSKVHTITGDVMKIHPHGDASVYETLVRMAQPWNMLIPYIEGQGNFGTISGDEAAAARYIEARLSDYAIDCFFTDWDPDLVLMEETYNRDLKEPVYLPTKYPNCLLSYSDGLGFGPATHIATFNFQEVIQATIALIKDPKYKPYLVPDITTGCLIVDEGKFGDICETGRGTFKMRAEIEKNEEKKCLVIKSIPFQVSLLSIKEKIKELVENKIINGFKAMKDYSATKIHLELYFRNEVDLDNIISILYTKTRLQDTYPVQMKMVDDFAVVDFNVRSALLRWIDIRFQFKRKKFIKKLVSLEERNHILNVLIMILDGTNGEKTIKIIKSSDREQIVEKLVKAYNITTLQAREISNMRLNAFSKTALAEYKKELKENIDMIKTYTKVIRSRTAIDDLIIKELEDGIKKYSAPRRSKVVKAVKEYKYTDYDAKLIFTKHGYVKKLKDGVKRIGNLPETDEPVDVLTVNNREEIVIFDKRGSVHTIEVGAITQDDLTTIGTQLSLYCTTNGSPVSIFRRNDINPETAFLFVTKKGIIKKTTADNFAFKNSIISITIKPDDELVEVIAIDKDIDIVGYTDRGYGLRFNSGEVPFSKRMAVGVIGLPMIEDDFVVGVQEIHKSDKSLFICTSKGYVKKCSLEVFNTKKRNSLPESLIPIKPKDHVISMIAVNDKDQIVVITMKQSYTINMNELPAELKFKEGTKLIPLNHGDMIVKVHK